MKKTTSKKESKRNTSRKKKILIKLTFILIALCLLITLLGIGAYKIIHAEFLTIKDFQVFGNKYLRDREIISLLRLKKNQNILLLDTEVLSKRLLSSPWIKTALLRKEYPNKLLIKVVESKPVALLYRGNKIYLVDDRGIKLERLSKTVDFLPVIKISTKDKDVFKRTYDEAIKLSSVVSTNVFLKDEIIEINASKLENISMNISGILVLVGNGDYERKLENYLTLKEEIKKRNISVEYIDVRFSKRLIVKPLKGGI